MQDSVDPLFKVDLQAALGNALAEEEVNAMLEEKFKYENKYL